MPSGRSSRGSRRRFPGARFGWNYSVVLNGFSVMLPRDQAERLDSVAGVQTVWPSRLYRPMLDRSVKLIKATTLYGAAPARRTDRA